MTVKPYFPFIVFIILMVIVTIIYPVLGYFQEKNLKQRFDQSANLKLRWYFETILSSWLPLLPIALLFPLGYVTFADLGFKGINLKACGFNNWLVYSAVVLAVLYFAYNIYSILVLKFDEKSRKKATKGFPEEMKMYLPISKKEKSVWIVVATSAGITEEIIYRGYLFFALHYFFPQLSVVSVLLISTLLFGLGHIYQGKEAIKPTIIGLFLGLFYLVFDSIVPVILIHAAQDLVVTYLFSEGDVEKNDFQLS